MRQDEQFIMSPKVDFAFKLIFGDEKNKDLLADLLSKVLRIDKDQFYEMELVNVELPKEFQEDKKGILDIRVKTKDKKHIDIEIQVIPHQYMPERSLFYWSKMYVNQIKSGYTYDCLQKCIAINIVDFNCIPGDKYHTSFHITEDETKYQLTDRLEIHFLELSKVSEHEETEDPAKNWVEFLNASTRGQMEMIAKQDPHIKRAYDILEVASKDEKARLAYEARQAAIMDQLTREKSAKQEGIQQGIQQGKKETQVEIARALIDILDDEMIALKTGLSIEEVKILRQK